MLSKHDKFPQESKYIEYKETWTPRIKREIGAFLNNSLNHVKHSFIYLGVNDDKRILTKSYSAKQRHKFEETISNWAENNFYPSAVNLIKVYPDNDPLCIEVDSGPATPYITTMKNENCIFIRNGSSSEKANPGIVKKLNLLNRLDVYDKGISNNQNLHFDYIKDVLNKYNKKHHTNFDLKHISNFYVNGDKLSNTALLISDDNPFITKVALYNGTTVSNFLDRKKFSGSIIKQINDIIDYINFNNHTNSIIEDKRRKDISDYPFVAIREAIVNAFAHRSYFDKGCNQIEIYNNRIEITSPGPLPNGLTVQDVMNGRAQARNYNLLNILIHLGYAENYGTGLRRIQEAYRKTNKDMRLKSGPNFVRIILPNINFNPNNVTFSYHTKLGIIESFIHKNKLITRRNLIKILHVSPAKSTRLLHRLTSMDILQKNGKSRGTYYTLKQNK